MKITAKMLRKVGVPRKQVAIFEKEWPEGMAPTDKNALRLWSLRLELGLSGLLTMREEEEWAELAMTIYDKRPELMEAEGIAIAEALAFVKILRARRRKKAKGKK